MRIKEARKAAGLSQSELARHMNLSRSTVAMWETEASRPDPDQIKEMSKLLCVSSDYLLGITDNNRPPIPQELVDKLIQNQKKLDLAKWICEQDDETVLRLSRLIEALLGPSN